jgi:small subunit ribosomal protein S8
MAQDIVADALNMIYNASKAGKKTIKIPRISKFLLNVLEVIKEKKYIESYKHDPETRSVEVSIGRLTACKAIKPRFTVTKDEIIKYMRRYLPARDYGYLLISTSKGLMTHEDALENGIGGCLVAYCY